MKRYATGHFGGKEMLFVDSDYHPEHHCDHAGCRKPKEPKFLYCEEHLGEEIERWLAEEERNDPA